VQNAKTLAEGATYGGGLAWITTNSSALTALAVIGTALASIYFGMQRKRIDERNAFSAEQANRINRREIIHGITNDLKAHGKSIEYIDDFIATVRH
jgi:hypothetical protein